MGAPGPFHFDINECKFVAHEDLLDAKKAGNDFVRRGIDSERTDWTVQDDPRPCQAKGQAWD
ncbi:hypothetical protein N7517_010561 [Penicillium concentricum]|uniref:Uncharacterized protein n=1 Tax=Penicillium concentricum TaxID=293559 RepID=A0A9W9R923_9EURO|nr:uncharacterized protein N7517_010561 [Penicillium concentricum]KAJ5355952.1 hypothetical protein N7517_010561 [Penicillium concentricum]